MVAIRLTVSASTALAAMATIDGLTPQSLPLAVPTLLHPHDASTAAPPATAKTRLGVAGVDPFKSLLTRKQVDEITAAAIDSHGLNADQVRARGGVDGGCAHDVVWSEQ